MARSGSCLTVGSSRPMVLKVDPVEPDTDIIDRAASLLREGGIVIYPTETFYGLGGIPGNPVAVERIYRTKERSPSKPLPLMASEHRAVLRVAAQWPPLAETLARRFWPGPLTLILPSSADVSPLVHAGTQTIAVRVSSHPVARALCGASGGLLIATSANRSGQTPEAIASRISQALLRTVDAVIDAGPCGTGSGLPSTIVDLCGARPRLVREGCLSWQVVREVIEQV